MELGPIQKQWIADMKKYPERQIKNQLGGWDGKGNMKACCLGQGVLTLCEIKAIKPLISDNNLCDIDVNNISYPTYSYKELGLRGDRAELINPVPATYFESKGVMDHYYSLSQMNDGGITWKEIAGYMEAHPENIFVESK